MPGLTDPEKLEEIWRILISRTLIDYDDYADLIDEIGRVYGDGRRWDSRTMPTR